MDHDNCRRLLASLSEFVDGSLSENLCTEIQRHLEDCENCRIVVDTLQKTVYLYHVTAEPVQMPEDVRSRLFHCLDLDEFVEKER